MEGIFKTRMVVREIEAVIQRHGRWEAAVREHGKEGKALLTFEELK